VYLNADPRARVTVPTLCSSGPPFFGVWDMWITSFCLAVSVHILTKVELKKIFFFKYSYKPGLQTTWKSSLITAAEVAELQTDVHLGDGENSVGVIQYIA